MDKKLYSQRSIILGTFFGGPLVAGYLMKKNYDALGQGKSGKSALILGVLASVLLFGGVFSLPESTIDRIPPAVIPTIYTAILYVIVSKTQGSFLKSHEANEGSFYSHWRAAGIGVISLVCIAAILFVASDLFGGYSDFDTTEYDKNIEQFIQNEEKALNVFSVLETESQAFLVQEFQKDASIWEENIAIMEELSRMENLPDDLIQQNELLLEYSKLRLQQFQLIGKAISEDTDRYLSDTEAIGDKIGVVLKQLNGDE